MFSDPLGNTMHLGKGPGCLTAARAEMENPMFRRYISRLVLLLGLMAGGAVAAHAATGQARTTPVGHWLTQNGEAVIAIEPCGPDLCGRIAGIAVDHPTDPLPTDAQGRSKCGLTIIREAREAGTAWEGRIVDPRSGNIYHARLQIDAQGRLHLRGYIGLPLFGQTQIWTPYEGPCRVTAAFRPSNSPQPATPVPADRFPPRLGSGSRKRQPACGSNHRGAIRHAALLMGALLGLGGPVASATAAVPVDLGFSGAVADLRQWVAAVASAPRTPRTAELRKRMAAMAARLAALADQQAALARAVRRNETPSPDDLAHSLRTVRDEYKYLAEDLEAADPDLVGNKLRLVRALNNELSLNVWLPRSGRIERLRLADPATRARIADQLGEQSDMLRTLAQQLGAAS